VGDLITTQLKKKENILRSLKLENIVNGVINTLFTKNQNFNFGLFALSLDSINLGSNERA
jgi:hypothetical protein